MSESKSGNIDHDRLFKELLSTFFWEFLELFLPETAAYVDRESITFLPQEVFIDVPCPLSLVPCPLSLATKGQRTKD